MGIGGTSRNSSDLRLVNPRRKRESSSVFERFEGELEKIQELKADFRSLSGEVVGSEQQLRRLRSILEELTHGFDSVWLKEIDERLSRDGSITDAKIAAPVEQSQAVERIAMPVRQYLSRLFQAPGEALAARGITLQQIGNPLYPDYLLRKTMGDYTIELSSSANFENYSTMSFHRGGQKLGEVALRSAGARGDEFEVRVSMDLALGEELLRDRTLVTVGAGVLMESADRLLPAFLALAENRES